MSRSNRFIVIAAALVGALGLGYWWGHAHPASTTTGNSAGARRILYWYDPMVPQERYEKPGKSSMGMTLIPKYADETAAAGERKALYWYDPMVPDQHFDKPGKSPFMDMALVPKYADAAGTDGIAITPQTRQNLGMRTVVVKRGSLAGAMQVPGTIGWDLRQERVVSARVDSIVEHLYVKAPFEPVRAGQPLARVLAPMWSTALAEARALGQAQSAGARALQSAARERLHVLGLPAGVGAGRGGSITLASPVTGVVSEIGVREGESAPAGMLLFRINGNATVWLEAAVPQGGIAGITAGTPVEAHVDAIAGQMFRGRVETLLPQIDVGSRTQRARIVLDNPSGLLAPGMFAQITLKPVDGAEHPLVPSDALIGTGGTQARVIVLGDDDTFHPVAVQPGRSSGGMTEILSGLMGGERVVASGQFLIDSEANLSGALERLGTNASKTEDNKAAEARP
jgi:Cu(I)/Ag(I) efflux system membrane fusion protein